MASPPVEIADQDGQASVGLIAVLPLLVGAALLLVQLGLVGYTAWSAANAARAAARADYVGTDPERAARAALPGGALKPEAEPRVELEGGIASVRLQAPRLPALGSLLPPIRLRSEAALVEAGD